MTNFKPVAQALADSAAKKKGRISELETRMAQVWGIIPRDGQKPAQKSPVATIGQNPFKKKRQAGQQQGQTLLASSPQPDPAFRVGGQTTLLG